MGAPNCTFKWIQVRLLGDIEPVAIAKDASLQCEGTMCPNGCCPEEDWFCCADAVYCAPSAPDCLAKGDIVELIEMAAPKCDGTQCPEGCCSGVYNWICCSYINWCTETLEDCIGLAKMEKLL